MLSSLKADPSLYFKTLGDVFRMEVIPHSESTVFFVFFLLKASDILSWLFGGTPRCRKHLEKRQRDKRERKKKNQRAGYVFNMCEKKRCSAVRANLPKATYWPRDGADQWVDATRLHQHDYDWTSLCAWTDRASQIRRRTWRSSRTPASHALLSVNKATRLSVSIPAVARVVEYMGRPMEMSQSETVLMFPKVGGFRHISVKPPEGIWVTQWFKNH